MVFYIKFVRKLVIASDVNHMMKSGGESFYWTIEFCASLNNIHKRCFLNHLLVNHNLLLFWPGLSLALRHFTVFGFKRSFGSDLE